MVELLRRIVESPSLTSRTVASLNLDELPVLSGKNFDSVRRAVAEVSTQVYIEVGRTSATSTDFEQFRTDLVRADDR